MEYLKSKFIVTTGRSDEGCKCFSGEKCKNFNVKCKDCAKIQGKWTEFEENNS